MTPPPPKTRLLGHPVLFVPLCLASLWSVYEFIIDNQAWPITAVIVALTNVSFKANAQVAAYSVWKRAWDDMAPASEPARRPRRPKPGLALAATGVVAAYLAVTTNQPGHVLALGWMATIAIIAMIVWAARSLLRRRARPRVAKATTVAVCIGKPLMPVPSLQDAYRRLPDYCLRVLSQR